MFLLDLPLGPPSYLLIYFLTVYEFGAEYVSFVPLKVLGQNRELRYAFLGRSKSPGGHGVEPGLISLKWNCGCLLTPGSAGLL